jgi:hypothetical protein
MADVASKQQTTALFLSTTVTRTRRHTELTQKTDKPDGKPVLCQRTFSSVFRAVFYTVKLHSLPYSVLGICGWTIKFAKSPPCACRGSTGQKPYYGLMRLTYQRFTAVLLLIYGNFFLSGIYYCLRVFLVCRCEIVGV